LYRFTGQNQNWLYSATYYDVKNRPVQSFSQNLYGQTERTDMEYNFAGEMLKMRQIHKNQAGTPTVKIKSYVYDHMGRKSTCKLDLGNISNETIANYEYDQVGRMKRKTLLPNGTFTVGGTPASIVRPPNPGANTNDIATQFISLQPGVLIDPANLGTYLAQIGTGGGGTTINGLQTIDYQYHIRGALRGINLDGSGNPTPNTSQGDLFSYKLDYETAGFYDGNIGKQTWNSPPAPDGGVRSYTYAYDASSRLKSATYTGVNGEDYSIPNMSYDANGNITNLQRNGKTTPSGGWGAIDNLNYSYNGNRLSQIIDNVGGSHEVDFVQRGGANYDFWPDGSLKSDANEQIQNINYDTFLQQPIQVQLTDGRTINYYYDGGGKLLKTVYSTGETWEFGNGLTIKTASRINFQCPKDGLCIKMALGDLSFFIKTIWAIRE
jgi:YD repeat-containing protein